MDKIEDIELLTDSEVCDLLRISLPTLRLHLRNGPPKSYNKDLRNIRCVQVGRRRRWVRDSVKKFIDGE